MSAFGSRWSWPALVGILALTAGVVSGWTVLQRIGMVLLVLLVLCLLATVLHALALSAEGQITSRTATVGDRLTIRYTLRNRCPWPLPWTLLEPQGFSFLPVQGQLVGLGPLSKREIAISLPCPLRGHWQAGGWIIRVGDPFGFFERMRSGPGKESIIVYPRPIHLPGLILPTTGEHSNSRRGSPHPQPAVTVREVRPYRSGDLPSRIHWLTTARLNTLMVKEPEWEPTAHVWLILDLDAGVHYGEQEGDSTELLVGVACGLVSTLLRRRLATGMLVVGPDLVAYPSDQRAQRERLLEILATSMPAPAHVDQSLRLLRRPFAPARHPMTPGETVGYPTSGLRALPSRGTRGGTVILLTPWADERWTRTLPALLQAGYTVTVVLLDTLDFGHGDALAAQMTILHSIGVRVLRHTAWVV